MEDADDEADRDAGGAWAGVVVWGCGQGEGRAELLELSECCELCDSARMRWKRDGERDSERRRERTEEGPESPWSPVGEGSASVPPPLLEKDMTGDFAQSLWAYYPVVKDQEQTVCGEKKKNVQRRGEKIRSLVSLDTQATLNVGLSSLLLCW